jgi:hypothetical protein
MMSIINLISTNEEGKLELLSLIFLVPKIVLVPMGLSAFQILEWQNPNICNLKHRSSQNVSENR